MYSVIVDVRLMINMHSPDVIAMRVNNGVCSRCARTQSVIVCFASRDKLCTRHTSRQLYNCMLAVCVRTGVRCFGLVQVARLLSGMVVIALLAHVLYTRTGLCTDCFRALEHTSVALNHTGLK